MTLLSDIKPRPLVAGRGATAVGCLMFGIVLALIAGCAGMHLPKTITQGDLTPLRKNRREEFSRQLERQRDFAEYEAAKAQWLQQRDAKGCRQSLEKLLARNPQHHEARELMADLVAVEDEMQAADEPIAELLPTSYTDPSSASSPQSAERAGSGGPADRADSAVVAEDDPCVWSLRNGQVALAEGQPEAALEHFRQAVAARPDNPQIPISAAAAALRANRPDLAVALLAPAAKQFPNSVAVHRMLGAAHYRTGDYNSSQVALQQALSLDKSSALSYLLMGCTLAKLGQNDSAEAHFRQARTLDSRYKVVR